MSSASSPTRRRQSPGRAGASKDTAVEMPMMPGEELKTGDDNGVPKGASSTSGRSVGFFDAAASEGQLASGAAGGPGSPVDMEVGPAVKVLSPTRTASTVMQTSGVEICFHQLSLTAHYVSKNFTRKSRKILKGISGTTRRGTCTALMGPSGCGKTSLLHTLAGKNDKTNVRACVPCLARVCACFVRVSPFVRPCFLCLGVRSVVASID